MFADKDEFKLFLTDGRNEMHNMAIKSISDTLSTTAMRLRRI